MRNATVALAVAFFVLATGGCSSSPPDEAPATAPGAKAPAAGGAAAPAARAAFTRKNYQYNEGMQIDLAILRQHGLMAGGAKDDFGRKGDVMVSESLAVMDVPGEFISAAVRAERGYLKGIVQLAAAPDAATDRLAVARGIVGLWVRPLLVKYAESIGTPVGAAQAPPTPPLADLIRFDCRRQLARDARLGKPPVIAADWLFYVRRAELQPTPPYAPKYPQHEVSLRELLDRFEPDSPVTAANADSVAEELLWARALGVGDGKYKMLDGTRRTLQALLFEAVGCPIGDPGDPDVAKAAAAIKKLEETKASFRKQWDEAAKQAPAAAPAKAVAPAAPGAPAVKK